MREVFPKLGSRVKVEADVHNCPYGLCGRKAAMEHCVRPQDLREGRGGRPGTVHRDRTDY